MNRICASCGAVNRIPPERLGVRGKCGRCKQELAAHDVPVDVPDIETFDRAIAAARVPVLVDFWATWCGPCRMVAPEVAKAARQLGGRAIVLKVDTDRLPELAQRYGVSGIPSFAIFVGGALAKQQAGAVRAAQLIEWVTVASRWSNTSETARSSS